MSQAFDLGRATIFQCFLGVTLFSMALVALSVTVLTWHTNDLEYSSSYRTGLIVCATGIVWLVITILLPGVFLAGPILEYRMLHFPGAGASITIGALVWLITKRLSHGLWPKFFIAVTGIVLILSTVFMVGFARAFAARSSLDQRQITAVVQALPSQSLPENSCLVVYDTDEYLFGKSDGISRFLTGVFQTHWSAAAAFNEAYQRNDLEAITGNRRVKLRFDYACNQEPVSKILHIKGANDQGKDVRVDQILMFGYTAGKISVVEKLTVVKSDQTRCVVQFPTAAQLRLYGVPMVEVTSSN